VGHNVLRTERNRIVVTCHPGDRGAALVGVPGEELFGKAERLRPV
jgi:hypothetical protein